jgi:hypothetical protein
MPLRGTWDAVACRSEADTVCQLLAEDMLVDLAGTEIVNEFGHQARNIHRVGVVGVGRIITELERPVVESEEAQSAREVGFYLAPANRVFDPG